MNRKVSCLDGLRGIAALVVVFTHIRLLLYPRFPDPRFLQTNAAQHLPYEAILEKLPLMILLNGGGLAVYIFFVHSGFVLSYKYARTGDLRILISMATRRLFRLGIPVAAAVFFAYMLMRLSLMRNLAVASQPGTGAWFIESFYTFPASWHTAMQDALGGVLFNSQTRYNGVFWTMYVECICSYLVFASLPLLFRIPIKMLVGFLGILFFVTPMLPTTPVYLPFLVYFYAGIVFCALYVRTTVFRERIPALFRRFRWLCPGLLLLAIVPWLYMPAILRIVGAITGQQMFPAPAVQGDQVAIHRILSWLTIGEQAQRGWMEDASSLLIVIVVLGSSVIQRGLEKPICQRLGRWSFSAYLVHLPIICSFSSWFFMVLSRDGIPYNIAAGLTFLVSIPIIYGVAAAMARYIDRFAIDFGKSLINRLLFRTETRPLAERSMQPLQPALPSSDGDEGRTPSIPILTDGG